MKQDEAQRRGNQVKMKHLFEKGITFHKESEVLINFVLMGFSILSFFAIS